MWERGKEGAKKTELCGYRDECNVWRGGDVVLVVVRRVKMEKLMCEKKKTELCGYVDESVAWGGG